MSKLSIGMFTQHAKQQSYMCMFLWFELGHSISYKIACSLDPHSVIRVFTRHFVGCQVSMHSQEDRKTDQPNLIWIFGGCTCNLVQNAVPWLILFYFKKKKKRRPLLMLVRVEDIERVKRIPMDLPGNALNIKLVLENKCQKSSMVSASFIWQGWDKSVI